MRTKEHIGLFAFAFSIALMNGFSQTCSTTRIADVKSILSASASPTGQNILFYGSKEEADGEVSLGYIFDFVLSGSGRGVFRLKVPAATNPAHPVWKDDGTAAYFDTDKGVYRFDPRNHHAALVWSGVVAGLAIAPMGGLLAFWRVGRGSETLIVFDPARRSEVQTWDVRDRFESDHSGWDLAFSPDGRSLYARTYDESHRTPLKRFDLKTRKIEIEDEDCAALAAGNGSVYYISNLESSKILYKIAGSDDRGSPVLKSLGYDTLFAGGNSRWIVMENLRSLRIGFLDTETDTIKAMEQQNIMTVLPDGRLMVGNGARISIGPASCVSSMDEPRLR